MFCNRSLRWQSIVGHSRLHQQHQLLWLSGSLALFPSLVPSLSLSLPLSLLVHFTLHLRPKAPTATRLRRNSSASRLIMWAEDAAPAHTHTHELPMHTHIRVSVCECVCVGVDIIYAFLLTISSPSSSESDCAHAGWARKRGRVERGLVSCLLPAARGRVRTGAEELSTN